MPVYHNCIQGSQEWIDLRLGIPTASSFDRIITPGGKRSAQWDGYRNELLAEKLTGRVFQGPNLTIMQRGKDLEPHACEYYKFQTGKEAEPVGFAMHDNGLWGASPDRTVGDRGLLEIKAPAPATHVGYLLEGTVSDTYKPQIMGQLEVTERDWVDIVSYNEIMPMALSHVERDDKFIATLEGFLIEFCERLAAAWDVLIKRGYVEQKEEQIEGRKEDSWGWFDVTDADVERMLAK